MTICTSIILDASGSMSSIQDEIVDAFNEQVQTAQEDNPDGLFSLVTFSTTVNEPEFWLDDVQVIEGLDEDDYVPGGMTALHDAIGDTIERLEEEAPDDGEHLVIILSDGEENNSKRHDMADIQSRIEELEEGDWTFLYIGMGEDLAEHAERTIGLAHQHTVDVDHSSAGTQIASDTIAAASSQYYGERSQDIDLEETANKVSSDEVSSG